MSTRHCRRKHWRIWTTKILEDSKQIIVCPYCGPVKDENPKLH